MADTLQLWEEIKAGLYEVYISTVTIEELQKCAEPKQSILFDYLNEIQFQTLTDTLEISELAEAYITNEILRRKSYDDCLHIAYAVVYECDMIVSWNFKHIVNHKTIRGVRFVNGLNNYKEIGIYSPSMLINTEEEE